jgi:PKHD-type hydroxylase
MTAGKTKLIGRNLASSLFPAKPLKPDRAAHEGEMFLEIPDLLTAAEVAQAQALARAARFVDGKITNPHNTTKNNLQIDYADQAYQQSSALGLNALKRSETFRNFAFPRLIAPPLLSRYEPGMKYGAHADAPFMLNPTSGPLRSDLSCTIFLEEPEAYDGGELVVHLGTQATAFKPRAGAAVVYPSTTLHEVAPVTRGQRLVMITFIQSQIREAAQREIVYLVGEVSALEGLTMKPENRMLLEMARSNLMRMWLE